MPVISEYMQAEEGIPLCSIAAEGEVLEAPLNQRPKQQPALKAKTVVVGALVLVLAGTVVATTWSNAGQGSAKVADLGNRIEQEGFPTGGKCAQFGCGTPLNPANLCQCDGQCGFRGDCCEDFGLTCPQVPRVPGPVEQAQAQPPGASLYCFSLMVPGSYEEALLKWQKQANAGIFQCDEYTVFANVALDLGGGVQTYSMGGTLEVPYKDIYALNTDVFIRMWKVIAYIGSYRNHDWSIKVDVDCVFFPQRFKDFVSRTDNQQITGPLVPAGPVWLNNCQYGMHGPIEVISRDGMDMFLQGIDGCEGVRQKAMDLNVPPGTPDQEHGFGEDQFARECWEQMNIPKVNEFETLLSERWNCIERPKDCTGPQIAFHAWKDIGAWGNCWQVAQQPGNWPR